MTRRARLLDALDAHRAAFSARLDELPDEVVHARPALGAWSLAQLAEHFVLVDAGLVMIGPASGVVRATSRLRSTGLAAALSLPLRLPAPPSARGILPTAAPRWPEVRPRWAAVRDAWPVSALGAVVAYRHPLAGLLLLDDALAFLLAHRRHHDAQVRRTLAALSREEA